MTIIQRFASLIAAALVVGVVLFPIAAQATHLFPIA
jgi:hypothetical protein